ncbi:hypothetical protein AGDE_16629 [Angomonas deanei]|uniref:Uncharacterized protein n=1 Tax=Angomonas deanei TaxID=59799 RepID=A0A7G2C212_9TRYP|nr:hypothetical protein AGDE_16629 [Angomonas deanei]CAD2213780.1 hypothetical protein, conserved [Angomonas deanei]|eukprot:EPY16745.1 hypothetical protein AGDE_16629 [Angomonas deanei]
MHYAHVVMQESDPYYNQRHQVNEVRTEAFANGEIPVSGARENPLRNARPYGDGVQQQMMMQQHMMMQQQYMQQQLMMQHQMMMGGYGNGNGGQGGMGYNNQMGPQ